MIRVSELNNVKHPLTIRIFWTVVYLSILAALTVGVYAATGRIRTHTLPVGQVQLTTPYSKYFVGETVSFTLKNNYNSPIYIVNNCPSEPLAVYRLDSGVWVRQHDQASANDCPIEQRQVVVPANGIVNGTFALWPNLFSQPGKYRVVAFVEYYNALPYQEFEVITAPIKLTTPSTSINQSSATSSTNVITPYPYTAKQSKTVTISEGTIKVQYDSNYIYVISIAPASGCFYEGGASGPQVQVTFKCGGNENQVQLNLISGQLVYSVQRDNN